MKDKGEVRRAVRGLLSARTLGVLCSTSGDQPYASLVAYAFTPSLKAIIFATGRFTRKYENLSGQRKAAFLVDTRTNHPTDFARAKAVTVIGEVREAAGRSRETCRKLFLARHPSLEDFARAPSTAIFRLRVRDYVLVRNFQHVDILTMGR